MTGVVDQIVAGFNERDVDAFAAGYADGIVIEDARGEVLVRGIDELRGRYGPMFTSSPDLQCEFVHRVVVGEYVVDEERVTGRSATPERLVVVYHVADGVVDHERIVR